MKVLALLITLFTAALTSVAQTPDKDAYCKYVTEQAAAERALLRSPSAVIIANQPSTGTSPQLVVGASDSLGDLRKSGLVMKAAKENCDLYSITVDTQQRLLYAWPSMEKEILRHRLELIQIAANKLDSLVEENMPFVDAQNLTRPALYMLESAKVHLDTSRTATMTGIASYSIPTLSGTPLKFLISEKLAAEGRNLQATNKEQSATWDIKLSAGARRTIGSNANGYSLYGAYGEFNLIYNLGSRAMAEHIYQSQGAYIDWKRTQFDDVANQAVILKGQIVDALEIEKTQLAVLRGHEVDIETSLSSLVGIDTSNTIAFRNQLLSDLVTLRVETGDIEFRIVTFQQFLDANF